MRVSLRMVWVSAAQKCAVDPSLSKVLLFSTWSLDHDHTRPCHAGYHVRSIRVLIFVRELLWVQDEGLVACHLASLYVSCRSHGTGDDDDV